MKSLLIATALVATTALTANAQVMNALENWNTEVEFGYANSNGNTNSTDLKTGVKAEREYTDYIFKLNANATHGSTDGVRDEEKYEFSGTAGRKFNEKVYGYGEVDYIKDLFSGYDYQVSELVGLGYKWINTDTMKLDVKAGIGGRQSETTAGEEESEFVGKPALDFSWKVNEFVTVGERASATIGSEFTRMTSETYAESALSQNLFLKAAYDVTKTTNVPAGSKETDSVTSVSLVYKFKAAE